MFFDRFPPTPEHSHLVKEFWIVENPDPVPAVQKIIPDGYCELIFHYGDPYRIQLQNHWEVQDRALFSGQISRHFFLENTGTTAMLGIKLWPDAPFIMFARQMTDFTDHVVSLGELNCTPPADMIRPGLSTESRISLAVEWLVTFSTLNGSTSKLSGVISELIKSHGMTGIENLASLSGMTRRHLEREFKKVVGLTPKYFARIMQFNFIFEAMQHRDNSWVDVALDSGYFDQSHFIRNFKAFTGESPTEYGFDAKNLANFFLQRGE